MMPTFEMKGSCEDRCGYTEMGSCDRGERLNSTLTLVRLGGDVQPRIAEGRISGWKINKRKHQAEGVSGRTDLIGLFLRACQIDKISKVGDFC